MSERTALEIASRLEALIPIAGGLAVEALRRQHAEIERLKSDAERVNTYAKNLAISMHRKHFSHVTQWEPLPDTIGLITQIDNMSCWTGDDVAQLTAERETIISDFLKRIGQYVTNDSTREAAIAAAVAAEREACAQIVLKQDVINSKWSGVCSQDGDARATLQAAGEAIRARSIT